MMTDMMRKMRSVVDEHSVRRGRPILLAVRVPDSDGFRRAMGLDVGAWLEADSIDMLTVSDYWRMCPWETDVELAHRHGKKVYACLSESRERDKAACDLRNSIESYRGRAMQALRSGVDGIYLFNAQDVSNETLYNELGDAGALRARPKVYVSTARGVGNADFWLREGVDRFLEREFVCPSRPRSIAAGEELELPLPIGDEDQGDHAPACVLKLELGGPGRASVDVRCNATALALRPGTAPGEWLADVDRGVVENGGNTFRIRAERDTVLTDLMLWVFPVGSESCLDGSISVQESIKQRNELLQQRTR